MSRRRPRAGWVKVDWAAFDALPPEEQARALTAVREWATSRELQLLRAGALRAALDAGTSATTLAQHVGMSRARLYKTLELLTTQTAQ